MTTKEEAQQAANTNTQNQEKEPRNTAKNIHNNTQTTKAE